MASHLDYQSDFQKFIEDWTDQEGNRIYEQQLSAIIQEKRFILDFQDLYTYDLDLANYLLKDADTALENFTAVVNDKLKFRGQEIQIENIQIRNLPLVTDIRKIDYKTINKLILIEGTIVKATDPQQRIIQAAYICGQCKETILLDQNNQFIENPKECSTCGSRRGFELNPYETTYTQIQKLTIQEKIEDVSPGNMPRTYEVEVGETLIETAKPGDRVSITGYIKGRRRSKKDTSLVMILYMYSNHIEPFTARTQIPEIDETVIQEFHRMTEDPDHVNIITCSIASSLYGLTTIKEAIALLLVGGIAEERKDIRIRGDINILIIGDPGTGKSQLLRFVNKIMRRSVFTTGKGSSAAGLTAAVIKNKDGGYTLEAGALVLADQSICLIDEMDKMDERDRGAIHPAMEQQLVFIAKGGIVATLNSRCSVLGAANPTLGRYNIYQSIAQNIKTFPVTLLNRFDLIFILQDIPDEKTDLGIANKVLGIKEQNEPLSLDPSILRMFIEYARTINPTIPLEVTEHLRAFYRKLRKIPQGEAIAINARQLESLKRLTVASARLHLRTEATIEDALTAIRLFTASMKQVGIDPETGEFDIDLLETGIPRSLRDKLWAIVEIVGKMQKSSVDKTVDKGMLIDYLREKWRMKDMEVKRLLDATERDGLIFSPRPGLYKLV